MAKYDPLNTITSLANTSSAKEALNENFSRLAEAIDDTLSRTGRTPNQMEADIDMDSNDLLNAGRVDAQEYYLNGVPWEQTVAYANKQYETFSGDGVNLDFTLNKNPGSLGNLEVSIEGVMQRPGIDFTFNDTTLHFTTAPPDGEDNILVRYDEALSAGVGDSASILYTPPSTGESGSVRDFLDSLWAATTTKGSALIRWIGDGVGAVARSVWSKLADHMDIRDFGGVGDGTVDDSVALTNALAEAVSSGKPLRVPAGIWKITTEAVVDLDAFEGVVIYGDGSGRTVFKVDTPSGDFLSITSDPGNWWMEVDKRSKVALRYFSVATENTNQGVGIKLNMGSVEGRPAPLVDITDVEVRGYNSFFHYFTKGFYLLDTTDARVARSRVIQGGPGNTNGIGFDIQSSSSTSDPTSIKFHDCEVVYGQYGWQIGDYVEGVYLTQCDGVNVTTAVRAVNTTGESGLHIVGGHANCSGVCYDLDGMHDFIIHGPLMYSSAGSGSWRGVKVRNGASGTITGCVMRAGTTVGEIGIDVDALPGGFHGLVIADNHISNIATGIQLGAGALNVDVGRNHFVNVGARVTNLAGLAAGNIIYTRQWPSFIDITPAGGAPSENIDITLPAGYFATKPTVVVGSSASQGLTLVYDHASAFSTATNARCQIHKLGGGNILAAATRITFLAVE